MEFLDLFLHVDKHLENIINEYQNWTYLILFLIIFIETGLVIWPFLPGDSLLFAAGAIIAGGNTDLNVITLILLLIVAAFLGDTVNYLIGKYFGKKLLGTTVRGKLLVKAKYMDKTHEFYEKHGPKTIILARFVPIVRTFAPFVAGIGKMHYGKFLSYNIIGGVVWITSLTLLGYFIGTNEVVKNNFELVVLGIVGISVLPMIVEFIRNYLKNRNNKAA
jgi:membrane-associated protein